MKIGIIGAGFIGRAVAQLALAAGHEVMLSNSRGPQSMSSVLSGIRGVQVGTAQDAAQFGELVLLAIPFEHYRSVPAQWLEGKTVMDANSSGPKLTVTLYFINVIQCLSLTNYFLSFQGDSITSQ